jgi:hypothetical protein
MQYTATTPKYNFPQPTMDTALPQHFTEQSIYTLKHIEGRSFQPNQQAIQQPQGLDQLAHTAEIRMEPITLTPRHEQTTVAACDTSTMRIAETATGMLIAVRGAAVWRQSKKYRYMRLGPFVFHVTEENKIQLFDTLEKSYFDTPHGHGVHYGLSLMQMPLRIAGLLERWLQVMLARTLDNGLILLDGSLTAGTCDTPSSRIREILVHAGKSGNVIMAFSKMTSLRVGGHLITDTCFGCSSPSLLHILGLRPKPPTMLFGDVYVARLSKGGCAFRLDIDSENPFQRRIEAVEKLLGNDVLTQGYPETLRLSHILCTFTANEVLAMQHFAVRRYGLQIIERPDMHRLLFGPFGRGEA